MHLDFICKEFVLLRSHVDYIVCPKCKSDFELLATQTIGEKIKDGEPVYKQYFKNILMLVCN